MLSASRITAEPLTAAENRRGDDEDPKPLYSVLVDSNAVSWAVIYDRINRIHSWAKVLWGVNTGSEAASISVLLF